MKQVKVIVSPDGSKVDTEVNGVKGQSCTDLTKNLIEALGTVEDSGKTPEYYQEELHNQHINGG